MTRPDDPRIRAQASLNAYEVRREVVFGILRHIDDMTDEQLGRLSRAVDSIAAQLATERPASPPAEVDPW